MEFIDKTKSKANAEAIINVFMRLLKEKNNPYPKDLYNALKSTKTEDNIFFHRLLIAILREEQHRRCCYCMRRLDNGKEETLEHIIPNKLKDKTAFERYLNSKTALNNKNICFAPDFIANETETYPPYPHTIAYQNLLISCDGKINRSGTSVHCNNKRGDDFVEPFVLYSDACNNIEYNSDGFIEWRHEKMDNSLNLNYDRLRIIRRIWMLAYKNHIDLMSLDEKGKIIFLTRLQKETPEKEWHLLSNFKNVPTYWELLLKYDYFAIPYKIRQLARRLDNLKANETRELLEILSQRLVVN
jgi:hypothetical protein